MEEDPFYTGSIPFCSPGLCSRLASLLAVMRWDLVFDCGVSKSSICKVFFFFQDLVDIGCHAGVSPVHIHFILSLEPQAPGKRLASGEAADSIQKGDRHHTVRRLLYRKSCPSHGTLQLSPQTNPAFLPQSLSRKCAGGSNCLETLGQAPSEGPVHLEPKSR